MHRTLILFDGRMSSPERMAGKLACLIGNSLTIGIEEAPEDLTPYDGFCFIFNFYGAVTAGRTKSFLIGHRDELAGKRIVFVGVGFSDAGYAGFVTDAERASGVTGISGVFISSEEETVRVGYEIGKMMKTPFTPMDPQELLERIETFIACHNTLALATSGEGYVRSTPAEYHYIDGAFYLITEGGLKFRGIFETGNVAASVFDAYMSFDNIHSLQFQGKAEVIPAGSAEYARIMDLNGISDDTISSLPVSMFLVKISPMRYEYFDSDFEEEGCDVCQILETEFMRELRESGAEYASAVSRSEMTNEEAARLLKEKLEAREAGNPDDAEHRDSEETAPAAEPEETPAGGGEVLPEEEPRYAAEAVPDGFGLPEHEEETNLPEEDPLPGTAEAAAAAAGREDTGLIPPEGEDDCLVNPESGDAFRAERGPAAEEEGLLPEAYADEEAGTEDVSAAVQEEEPSGRADRMPENAGGNTVTAEEGSFKMPSFMKPYIEMNGQMSANPSERNSIPLPKIDMSVLDGIDGGGRHRFDEEEPGRGLKPRQKAVTFLEPDDGPADLEEEFEEEDSPVLEAPLTDSEGENAPGAGRRKKRNKKRASRGKEDRAASSEPGKKRRAGKGGAAGLLSRIGRAVNRMLLIDDLEDEDAGEDDADEDEA